MAVAKYVHLLEKTRPVHYDLKFVLKDLSPFSTFTGVVVAELEVCEDTDRIEMHSKDMKITSASATTSEGEVVDASSVEILDSNETVAVQFMKTFCRGSVVRLRLEYSGIIRKALSGLYSCAFEDGVRGVCTHFEPVYARYAFPCIDEPAAKASFQTTIAAPKQLTVISNMPEDMDRRSVCSEDESLTEHFFGTSPKMSPYLVALSVGDYSKVELSDPSIAPVPMSLYVQRGREHLGKFALQYSAISLAHLEKFFDQKYPLPKLDVVIVPEFPINGMENWGMVTLKDRSLLDEKTAALSTKMVIAELCAHEVSHMWFGNLCTPQWWDDLWLKEGFASWVNLLPLDEVHSNWRLWDRWLLNFVYAPEGGGKGGSLAIDQHYATHAVEVPVNFPAEAQEVFDALSYSKGATMVNMLCHFLGMKAFQKGLSAWLEHYKFGNSTTRGLWEFLQAESADVPVAEMMSSWTQQEGFPLVEVCESADGKSWEFSQRRFTLLHKDDAPAQCWIIPLLILNDGSSEVEKIILRDERMTIPKTGSWIKVNAGARTPLRVHHSPQILKTITENLKNDASTVPLAPADRMSLIDDNYALLRAGVLPASSLFGLLEGLLSVEEDPLVWMCAANILSDLLDRFGKHVPGLQKFVATLAAPQMDRVGWTESASESEDDSTLRPLIISLMVKCQNAAVLEEAIKQSDTFLCEDHNVPPPPPAFDTGDEPIRERVRVRGLVAAYSSNDDGCPMCGLLDAKPGASTRGVALRSAVASKPELFSTLSERLVNTIDLEERDQLLYGLTGHTDRSAIDEWIAEAFSSEGANALSSQEWPSIFDGLAKNKRHPRCAWDALVKHWEVVYAAWGQSQFKMKAIVASAMTNANAQEAKTFFEKNPCNTTALVIQRNLEVLAADEVAMNGHVLSEVKGFFSS